MKKRTKRKQARRPIVSVLMTALNSARFVGEAVESILGQTLKDWELIVVDGGSTDGTVDILRRYRDRRIRLFVREGLRRSAQLNWGMNKILGRYVAIMDSDDIALPERLEKQLEVLSEHPKITVLGSFAYQMRENGTIYGVDRRPVGHDTILRSLISQAHPLFPTIMWRITDAVQPVYFNEVLKKREDIEWYVRKAFSSIFETLPVPLVKVRQVQGSLSRLDYPHSDRLVVHSIEEYCGRWVIPNDSSHRYLCYLWQGMANYYYGSLGRSRYFLARALKYEKLDPIVWRYFLPATILPQVVFHWLRKAYIPQKLGQSFRNIFLGQSMAKVQERGDRDSFEGLVSPKQLTHR